MKEPGSYERAEQWAEVLEQSDGKRAMELMKGLVLLFLNQRGVEIDPKAIIFCGSLFL